MSEHLWNVPPPSIYYLTGTSSEKYNKNVFTMSWRKASWIRGLAMKGRGLELNFYSTHIKARHGGIPVTSVPSQFRKHFRDLVKLGFKIKTNTRKTVLLWHLYGQTHKTHTADAKGKRRKTYLLRNNVAHIFWLFLVSWLILSSYTHHDLYASYHLRPSLLKPQLIHSTFTRSFP